MEITFATTIHDSEINPSLIGDVLRHGFRGIEIDLNGENSFSQLPPKVTFRFHSRQYDLSLAERSIFNYYRETIERIAQAGCDYLTLHYGFETNELNKGGVNFLKNLVKIGKDFGVTIAIENLKQGITSQPEKLLRLLEETDASLTIDLGHLKSSFLGESKEELQKAVFSLLPYVREVHIYEREENGHVPPKDIFNLSNLLETLFTNSNCYFWVIELPLKEAAETKLMIEKEFPHFFTI
jgi:sugar phosphate isomerase/epimerase